MNQAFDGGHWFMLDQPAIFGEFLAGFLNTADAPRLSSGAGDP